MSTSQAATAVYGDCAMASSSAPSCPPATMAGMAHTKDFTSDVLLETGAARGKPDTISRLSEPMLGSPKLEEKSWNIFRGSHWSRVMPFGHPSRMEANPRSCSQAHTNLFSQHEPLSSKDTLLVIHAGGSGCVQKLSVHACKPT